MPRRMENVLVKTSFVLRRVDGGSICVRWISALAAAKETGRRYQHPPAHYQQPRGDLESMKGGLAGAFVEHANVVSES